MKKSLKDIDKIKKQFFIVGNSLDLNRAVEIAAIVANTELSVLITGENGSGKESFSKIIHCLSSRSSKKFIALNCGAIPEGTIDSELFGHKKGAFTGAIEDRKGYFEEVDEGTIFLDEIGDLPLSSQARILRVLEYGEIMKVGTSKVQKVDVRIVAATNVNLEQAIYNGKFREDLYYRLNAVPIKVPPLRDRGDDVLLLFSKFAADFADKYKSLPIYLTEEAKIEIMRYLFPGNVRQLRNLVERLSILQEDREISREIILEYLPNNSRSLPTLFLNKEEKNTNDVDLLYSMIWKLKEEIDELRNNLGYSTSVDKLDVFDQNKSLSRNKMGVNILPASKSIELNEINSSTRKKSKKNI